MVDRLGLVRATRACDQLRLMRRLRVADRVIARSITDARARDVRRWRRSGAVPCSVVDQLRDLYAILCFLVWDGTYDVPVAVAWLRSRPESLGSCPLDALREGRIDEVLVAAEEAVG